MPSRRRRVQQAAVVPSSSMVASAITYSGKVARIFRGAEPWQRDCYRHFRICGEARYAATYYGNAMGRATLHAAKRTPTGIVKQTSGAAYDRLEELFNGKQGQAQMLTAAGLHLTIAGEFYLVGRGEKTIGPDEKETTADIWEIVSVTEINVNGSNWSLHYEDGRPDIPLADDDVVIRIWRPDPANRMMADSPFRSLLPILDEIEYLTMHVFAQIRSRLAGAGIMLLNQDIDFPPPPGEDGANITGIQNIMQLLADAMVKPIQDQADPRAVVPIIGSIPGDQMENALKLFTFWSELDENSKDLRDEAIRRFALGMDLPVESVLGMSSNTGTGGGSSNGVSHWGAWQIDESSIKMHTEPGLELVCNALIMGYLRPLTKDPLDLFIYDTSALRLRPDRSKESIELHAIGALSTERMLEENGFTKDDLPNDAELRRWMLMKVAMGSATPEQVGAALKQLGVDLGIVDQGTNTREARPEPSLEDHPTRPRTPAENGLLAASEALVFRALERAGNRIKGKGIQPPGVASYEMHTVHAVNGKSDIYLEDAWSCAPQVLEGIADDPEKVVATLNAYVKSLFDQQALHSRDRLSKWLEVTT